jgi:hypothetical protein
VCLPFSLSAVHACYYAALLLCRLVTAVLLCLQDFSLTLLGGPTEEQLMEQLHFARTMLYMISAHYNTYMGLKPALGTSLAK